MGMVLAKAGEPLDVTIRRFKRNEEKSGTLKTLRRKQFHEKKWKKKQRAKAAAVKRLKKKLMKERFGVMMGETKSQAERGR